MAGSGDATKAGPGGRAWPWYVRWLAVAYALSLLAGPAGFFVLLAVATVLIVRDGPAWDGPAATAVAAAWAWLVGCAAFRWWFRAWGRRRWQEAEPDAPPARAGDIGSGSG
jgi:hypothetical protein